MKLVARGCPLRAGQDIGLSTSFDFFKISQAANNSSNFLGGLKPYFSKISFL